MLGLHVERMQLKLVGELLRQEAAQYWQSSRLLQEVLAAF
jgi:hypothetical protein